MSKGIFHDLILEEYQKNSKKNVDIVRQKRETYNDLLINANKSLKILEYENSKELYGQVLNLLKDDPYPDEYDLEEDTLFCIQCCLYYSTIYSFDNMDELDKSTVNFIDQCLFTLIESYPNKILPYYLRLLFDHRKPK